MQKKLLYTFASLSSATCLSITPAINAASIVEEVIVTAQKREQSLQEIPVSVSVLNEFDFQQLGIAGLEV